MKTFWAHSSLDFMAVIFWLCCPGTVVKLMKCWIKFSSITVAALIISTTHWLVVSLKEKPEQFLKQCCPSVGKCARSEWLTTVYFLLPYNIALSPMILGCPCDLLGPQETDRQLLECSCLALPCPCHRMHACAPELALQVHEKQSHEATANLMLSYAKWRNDSVGGSC